MSREIRLPRPQCTQEQRSHDLATLSSDAESSLHADVPPPGPRRRPSLSAMAALFSPNASTRIINNSWNNGSQSSRKVSRNAIGNAAASSSADSKRRGRRPSVAISSIKRGLFGQKSKEEMEVDEEIMDIDTDEPASSARSGWLKKFTSPFKRERTSSLGEMDAIFNSDPFYSLSASVPVYPDGQTKHWTYGGAAARAAAAAQNEASSTSLIGQGRDLSRLREPQNDSESGIGIDLNDGSDNGDTKTTLIRVDPASILPEEIFAYCLSYLDATSLTDAELVSKRWHVTCASQSMWRHLFGHEFGRASRSSEGLPQSGGLGYGTRKAGQEWKRMWKARKALQQRWVDGHAAAIYLEGHTDTVYCVQFDENKVVTGSRDRTLRVWDIKTLQCIKVIGAAKPPGQSHWHPAQPLTEPTRGCIPFVTITPTQQDNPSGSSIRHVPSMTHHGSILCLQFDSKILVTGSSDTTVLVWSLEQDYKPLRRLERHTAGVLDVCFDSKYIVSCSKDTTICLWNRETGELLRQLSGHRGPVNAVQLRGELVVSASGDGIAKLWNIASGLCVKEFSSRDRGLACVEFSPDCRYIYAGGNDQSIYQFDATTRELIHEFKGHRALVRSLHLDQLNNRMVSGSYDHSIQVYNTQTGEQMCEFAGWTTSWMLSAKMDYRRIIATSQDRRVVLIDFGLGVKDIDLLSGNPPTGITA